VARAEDDVDDHPPSRFVAQIKRPAAQFPVNNSILAMPAQSWVFD
jgi:hypothetical protein